MVSKRGLSTGINEKKEFLKKDLKVQDEKAYLKEEELEPELKINDSRYCKDSDGGLNFYEPGKISVTGKIAWYSPFSLIKRVKELNREISDTCVSESILREYSCEKATGKSLEVECPDGCSEGACNLLIGDRVWKRGMQEEDIPPLAKKYYGKSQAEIEEMFKEGFSGRALTGRAISADYEEKSFELEKEDIIEPFSMELPIESLIVKNDICDNYDKKYKNYPQLKGREDLMIKWGNLLEEYYSYNSMYSVSKSDMQRLREIKGAIFAKIKEETANSIEFQRLKKKGQITPPYYYSTDIVALFDMPMIKYNFQSSSRQCVEEKEENSKRYSYGFIYNKPDKENDVVHKGVFEPDLNTGWTYVTAVPADNRGSFSFDKVGIRNAEDGIFEPQFKIFAPVADNLGGITGEMKLIYSQGKELRVIYRSKYSIPAQVLNGKEQVGLKEEITEYVTVFVKGGTIGGFFGEPGEQGSGTNPHEAVLAYIEHGLFATDYQLTALSKQRMRAYEKLIELKKEIQEVREELEAA